MNILLTNDDGILAPGLNALYEALAKKGHKVLTVAPATEKSATSQAITVGAPLKVTTVEMYDGETGFAVEGTPADCALLGFTTLAENPIDLVFSGINNGPNLGYDINYSGTVAAAIEAAAFGYPAIAVSLGWRTPIDGKDMSLEAFLEANRRSAEEYLTAAHVAVNLLSRWDSFNLPRGVALNVNVPDLRRERLAGERWSDIDGRPIPDYFIKDEAPDGSGFLFTRSRSGQKERSLAEVDERHLAQGFVTLTPIRPKFSCEQSLKNLQVCC